MRKLHKELLTQVEKTLRAIEERLADKEAWSAPEEKAGVSQDVNVELAWSVEPSAPQENEEYREGYGKEDEESDDEWDSSLDHRVSSLDIVNSVTRAASTASRSPPPSWVLPV